MPSSTTLSSSVDWSVVQNLVKIRDTTAHLGALLQPALMGHPAAEETFEKLRNLVSSALALLDTGVGSPSSEHPWGEISGGKRKTSPVGARRRVRRRRSQPYSWTKVISKTLDDGHAWRKYGQKDIQSAKYPRSYFRCSHKYDQACKAVRQVQSLEDDPSTYVITYLGEHTCKDSSMIPQMISTLASKDSHLIRFGATSEEIGQEVLPQPSPVPSLKREYDEEVQSNLTTLSSSPAPSTENPAVIAQIAQSSSDHGKVTSGFEYSPGGLEMEFMAELFEFEGLLGFDADFLN